MKLMLSGFVFFLIGFVFLFSLKVNQKSTFTTSTEKVSLSVTFSLKTLNEGSADNNADNKKEKEILNDRTRDERLINFLESLKYSSGCVKTKKDNCK